MFQKYSDRFNENPFIFLANRGVRVYIPYFIATIAFCLVSNVNLFTSDVLYSLALLNHKNSTYSVYGIPTLPPGWSINYEILFYFSCAVSLAFKRRIPIILIITILVLTGVFVPRSFIFLEICIGAYLYIYKSYIDRLVINKKAIITLVVIASVSIVYNKNIAGDFISINRFVLWGIPAAILFTIYISSPLYNFKDALFGLFNISYSLYLTHWIVLELIQTSSVNSYIMTYFLIFVSAVVMYLFVERPAHKISKSFI